MILFTDLAGLAGCAIAMVAALMLPGAARIPKRYRIGLACAVAVVALIPFGGLPLAAYVRGVTGDLSIASLVLLVLAIQGRLLCRQERASSRPVLLVLIVLAALALYPLALGMGGSFDPYRLGYGNAWFLGGLLLLALFACFRQQGLVALVIALAVLAWALGWYESPNLWDYLLDPWLAIYAVGALIRRVPTS